MQMRTARLSWSKKKKSATNVSTSDKHVNKKQESCTRQSSGTFRSSTQYPLVLRNSRLADATISLWEKRKAFNDRMMVSSEKRTNLKQDLEYLHQRKMKSEAIVRDNDSKRWRALQKFCEDNHLCSVRKKEKHMLNTELRQAKQLYAELHAKVAELRKYENYMLDVIASLPKDYIKLADNVIAGLMMRYNTLYETNTSLRREMEAKSEEVRIAQTNLRNLIEAHGILLFGKNSELSELYTLREKVNDLYQSAEQSLVHTHDEVLNQLSFFETVIRSINNLSGKLLRSFEPHLPSQQLLAKVQNMPILSRCRLIGERTLSIRNILSQLAIDTGTLPISTCSRPELENGQANAIAMATTSEFTLLSKLTSTQSELPQ